MQTRLAISLAVLALALTGQAYASTAACPAAGAIKQTPYTYKETSEETEKVGHAYGADGPDGSQWKGDNPEAESSYTVSFVSVQYKQGSQAVICDYEGEDDAAIRLVLKTVNDWKPSENTSWKDGFCKNADTSRCQFEYSSVTTAP